MSAFDRDANAFPSPRSWEFVSRILDSLDSQSNPAIEHEVIAGAVGTGAATEFSAVLRMFRGLPNIDTILLNPTQEPVPENAIAQYAVASQADEKPLQAVIPSGARNLALSVFK